MVASSIETEVLTLKDLAVDHPYYASESNWDCNDMNQYFSTMTAFLNEFEDADIDMNLIYRWDVYHEEDEGTYRAMVIIVQQRKGRYMPCTIDSITEDEVERFVELLKKHYAYLISLWNPITLKSEGV